MAKYKTYNYAQMGMMPVSLENQRRPGTLEFAIHELVKRRIDTSIFDRTYPNDATGCPAYDPKIWLQVIWLAYARGLLSSRKIEPAWRENSIVMALACEMVPDHSTIAAFIASMKDEVVSIFRAILLVCAEQDWLGGTHLALDGFKLPSNAAKEWSGTFDDLKPKKETLEAQVRGLLEEPEIAEKAGESACAEAYRAAQHKAHEQCKRLEKQAARIEAFWAANAPKRGKRGTARQSNVTDNDSAKRQTAHGVMQGSNGPAVVDAHAQVRVHAEAVGNGQDYGPVAPMVEGAKANLPAIGLPETYVEGKIRSAASHYHSEGKLQQCAEAKLDA
jgi:transposase